MLGDGTNEISFATVVLPRTRPLGPKKTLFPWVIPCHLAAWQLQDAGGGELSQNETDASLAVDARAEEHNLQAGQGRLCIKIRICIVMCLCSGNEEAVVAHKSWLYTVQDRSAAPEQVDAVYLDVVQDAWNVIAGYWTTEYLTCERYLRKGGCGS